MSYTADPLTTEAHAAAQQGSEEDVRIVVRIAEDIASRFATGAEDLPAAHATALRAIEAYGPRNNRELIQAARIVALSMTELDFLRVAAQPDLDPMVKIRLVREALKLERAAVENQRLLLALQAPPKPARRAKAEAPAEQPAEPMVPQPPPERDADVAAATAMEAGPAASQPQASAGPHVQSRCAGVN